MSMFGDYKAYKIYTPVYPEWKANRDLMDAKRLAYLDKHPEAVNQEDIKKGKIIIRAIDIMDEYSQKKAENMEAATEPVIGIGREIAGFLGAGLGWFLSYTKPVNKFFARFASKGSKYANLIQRGLPAALGLMLGSMAAFPLMAWGAKAEVGASRKGRFEAMRNELDNPNGFAILTEEQINEARLNAKEVILEEDIKKGITKKLSGGLKSLKEMAFDSDEYKKQKAKFEHEIENDEHNLNIKLSEKDILNAKKDQQLLTKLVEKIDIASQDYAENSELATQTGIVTVGAFGGLAYFGIDKLLAKFKIQHTKKISIAVKVLSFAAFAGMGIIAAQINKYASRVGRFKAKQELLQNPNNFVYVSDEQANEIKLDKIEQKKKPNIFSFLISAWKNTKEYEKYKKTEGKEERKFYKAAEQLNLTNEQIKDAKKKKKNAFRTFNKIDENSQKFAESIEAFGQSVAYPITTLCSIIATACALPYFIKSVQTKVDSNKNLAKYFGIIMLSTIPAIIINAIITREQKKASRVADMKAIDELNDYRKFK